PGKRTTGTKQENFAIVGPNWEGALPSELKEIKAPTNTVWIIGRIQTNGTEDYRHVNALQKKLKLTPLSAYGKTYQPSKNNYVNPKIDMEIPPKTQVEQMDVPTFFSKLSKLLKQNPPPESHQSFVKKIAEIGVVPGKQFDPKKL